MSAEVSRRIEARFPGLAGHPWSLASEPTWDYNCIAWAAGDDERWWWPAFEGDRLVTGHYWPLGPSPCTVDVFVAAFATLGYSPCRSEDLEDGGKKVAIDVDTDLCPTHAARQLPDGRWTSKLGASCDIAHGLLDLEGADYGTVHVFLARPRS